MDDASGQTPTLNDHFFINIMRTNKILAGIIVAVSYPILYYAWVKTIKNTWVSFSQLSLKTI